MEAPVLSTYMDMVGAPMDAATTMGGSYYSGRHWEGLKERYTYIWWWQLVQ